MNSPVPKGERTVFWSGMVQKESQLRLLYGPGPFPATPSEFSGGFLWILQIGDKKVPALSNQIQDRL